MSSALDPVRAQVAQLRERYNALQPRERWLVSVGSVLLLLTLIYLLAIEPVMQAKRYRGAALANARAVALKLEQAAQQVQLARGSASRVAAQGRNLSLMAAVDQASKNSSIGKAPARIQPEGEGEVRVWFEEVSFDAVVRWIADLQQRYGVTVQTLDVEPQDGPGQVNVRLSLVRQP